MAGEDKWGFSVQPEVYFVCQISPESAGDKLIGSGGWMNAVQLAANYLLFCIYISFFFGSLPEFLLLFSLTDLLLFLRGCQGT